jgi:hypothetical protein
MVTTALDSLLAGRPEQVADTILGELLGGSFSREVTSVLIHAGLARLLTEDAAGGVREVVRVLSKAPRPLPEPLVKAVEALQPSSGLSTVGCKGLALARLEVAAQVRPLSGELARLNREGLRPRQLVEGSPTARVPLSLLSSARGWEGLGAVALVRALRSGAKTSSLAARRGQLLDDEADPTPNDTTLGRSAAGAHNS